MLEKTFFPTKKLLKGSNVSITEGLTPKRMEILKKARLEHGSKTCGHLMERSCPTENKVKLYFE